MYFKETYKKVIPNNTLSIIYLSESFTIQKAGHLLLTVTPELFTIKQSAGKRNFKVNETKNHQDSFKGR